MNTGNLPMQPAAADTCFRRQSHLFWRRAAAFLIDLGLLGALHVAYFLVVAVLLFQVVPLDFEILPRIIIAYILFFMLGPFFLVLSYFTVLHGFLGQTVGKIIMGIRVTGVDGQPLPIGRSFLRTTGYFVSGLPLAAGFLWAVLDKEERCWHDRLAGSRLACL
jgi:uncharacterized RDD family membrane protein YckC